MTKTTNDATATAIMSTLTADSISAKQWDEGNITEVLDALAQSTYRVSTAICGEACPGTDDAGGRVGCLVEAVMGVTAGLVKIAASISDLAEAVRDTRGE